MSALTHRANLSPRTAVTSSILAVLVDGRERRYREIEAALRGKGLESVQIRNGLVTAQHNGRVLKRGTHGNYLYRLNPRPPAPAAQLAGVARHLLPPTVPAGAASIDAPALAPAWPAPPAAPRYDREPQWRIAA